jgi:RNA polymerase sigma-70 factor (ECF subfamily)
MAASQWADRLASWGAEVRTGRMTAKTLESVAESELVARSAAGDVDAFGRLYELHRRRVYSLCLRMMGNPADAEDMTQEVFMQVYRKIGSFRGEAAFTTWLHRLTVNQVLMHFRKRNVRLEMTTTEEDDMKDVVEPGTDRPQTMPVVDRIALEQAVAQLPPGYRTVFILHDVEGYEHEEIGQILDCSVGTSKSQLHKARMKLRKILRSEES